MGRAAIATVFELRNLGKPGTGKIVMPDRNSN